MEGSRRCRTSRRSSQGWPLGPAYRRPACRRDRHHRERHRPSPVHYRCRPYPAASTQAEPQTRQALLRGSSRSFSISVSGASPWALPAGICRGLVTWSVEKAETYSNPRDPAFTLSRLEARSVQHVLPRRQGLVQRRVARSPQHRRGLDDRDDLRPRPGFLLPGTGRPWASRVGTVLYRRVFSDQAIGWRLVGQRVDTALGRMPRSLAESGLQGKDPQQHRAGNQDHSHGKSPYPSGTTELSPVVPGGCVDVCDARL